MSTAQRQKDPRQQLRGLISRERGKQFEARIDQTFDYYKQTGFAAIDKTPEPMKPIQRLDNVRFVACYEKKAQTDYKGVVKGGREIVFEAKYTDAERMDQSRVKKEQGDYMDLHTALGSRCYVIAGFASGQVYRVPWEVWKNMKARFGRKYVTEADLKEYRVQTAWNGMLLLLN